MYRSIAEEEQNKQTAFTNNVKMEDDLANNNAGNVNLKAEINCDKKISNPFVKGGKEDGSKQKTLFEDLSKVTQSQNNVKSQNEVINMSNKFGFKRKANQGNGDEKNKIESQIVNSKVKK